tara:strand:- start:298 stop:879 length:582 start_codon:yes stop_codon:yes gene_type:complete
MDIISRKEAKAQGLKRYFTGKPCKHGHISERQISNGSCLTCQESATYKWRNENPEKYLWSMKLYRINNIDYFLDYYEKNKSRISERKRASHEKNPKIREKYYQDNKSEHLARAVARKISKIERTLPGHEKEIMAIYAEAVDKRDSGEDVHVDHIVPLQAKLVSGLHVPWNLQIISAKENLIKNNEFEPYTEFY